MNKKIYSNDMPREKKPLEKFPGIRQCFAVLNAATRLGDGRIISAALRTLKYEMGCFRRQYDDKEEENERLLYRVNEWKEDVSARNREIVQLKDEIEKLRKELSANKVYATWCIRLSAECKRRIRNRGDSVTEGWKIATIKEIRTLLNSGLADSKKYSEEMETNLGNSDCGGDWFMVHVDEKAFKRNMDAWQPTSNHKIWEMLDVMAEVPQGVHIVDARAWTYKG